MENSKRLETGNLSVEHGGLWGKPRHHAPPDEGFDKVIRNVLVGWRRDGKDTRGTYASRRIANVVHAIQHPGRGIGKLMQDAIDAGVSLDRVEELGLVIIQHARDLHARKRRRPAA